MAVSRDLGISLGSCPFKHHRQGSSFQPSKVTFMGRNGGVFSSSWAITQPSCLTSEGYKSKCNYNQPLGITGDSELFPEPVSQETEGFLPDAINKSFFECLNLVWKICSLHR